MGWKNRKEREGVRRSILLAILALELVWVASRLMYPPVAAPRALRGSLVKSGQEYHFGWLNELGEFRIVIHPSIEKALSFAQKELGLQPGRNPLYDDNMERIWQSVRKDKFVVLWKRFDLEFLHQLSFDSRRDADFFEQMFKQGAYSTSPLGHSVNFIPAETHFPL